MYFIWQAIYYSFKLICLLVTICLVAQGFHLYMQNDDSTTISFHSFYTTPDLVYPSGSVCFTSPYEGDKLNKRYNITRISDYIDFLSGEEDSWNMSMLGIDYDEMSLKPMDYILGYKLKYRNGTEETKIYNESKNRNLEKNSSILCFCPDTFYFMTFCCITINDLRLSSSYLCQ